MNIRATYAQQARLEMDFRASERGEAPRPHLIELQLFTPTALNLERLREALSDTLARHDAFSLVFVHGPAEEWFVRKEDEPRAVVLASSMPRLNAKTDTSPYTEGLRDHFTSPLPTTLAAAHIVVGMDATLVALAIDHIVVDGISVQILVRETLQRYENQPTITSDDSRTFMECIRRERHSEYFDSAGHTDALRARMGNPRGYVMIPTLVPLPEVAIGRDARRVHRQLPETVTSQARALARELRTSVFATLLHRVAAAAAAVTPMDAVPIRVYTTGRRPEAAGVIGWLADSRILDVPADLARSPSSSTSNHRRLLALESDAAMPYYRLLRELEPRTWAEPNTAPTISAGYSRSTPKASLTVAGEDGRKHPVSIQGRPGKALRGRLHADFIDSGQIDLCITVEPQRFPGPILQRMIDGIMEEVAP